MADDDSKVKENNRVRTSIEGLDKMLRGGLIQGRNILLSGPCGTGKSTIAMQFIHGGAEDGEKGLYVTLEEHKDKIMEDMAKFGLRMKEFEDKGMCKIIGGPLGKITQEMGHLDAQMKHIIGEIEEIIVEEGMKRVVIDSINVITMLGRNDEDIRMSIAALCTMLSSHGCTAMLISETKEGTTDLSRFGVEEFVTDGVIMLYLFREYSKFLSGVSVRKMRGTDHDKEIRVYKITDQGVKVYPSEAVFQNSTP